MKNIIFATISFILFGGLISCARDNSKHTLPNYAKDNKTIIDISLQQCADTLNIGHGLVKILKNIDLKGKTYIVPEDVIFCGDGGLIKNGTIIGTYTQIHGDKPIFDSVHITGSWNVPNISTKYFTNLKYENALQEVLALTNPHIKNNVVIECGDYWVSAKPFCAALSICSNTNLSIDGDIHLVPNKAQGCYILQVKNQSNIYINGLGTLYGDKMTHLGTDGEWGHGINIIGSHNVVIDSFRVMNCWGDCVYIGGKSSKVELKGCEFSNGRRQGISITSANNININNCLIRDVEGKRPQYAIDLEPNQFDTVSNISIENVSCIDCYGGITSWKQEEGLIDNIVIQKCKIQGTKCKWSLSLQKIRTLSIEECYVNSGNRVGVAIIDVNKLSLKKNTIVSSSANPLLISKCDKRLIKNNIIKNK